MKTNEQPFKIESAADLINSLKKGLLQEEIADAHNECIDAINETGKKATMTITVEYTVTHNQNGSIVEMKSDTKTKLPKLEVTDSLFLHPGNELSRTPVGQESMDFETKDEEDRSTVKTTQEPDRTKVAVTDDKVRSIK